MRLNNNHRPERAKPAFEASLRKLRLDYVDLYLMHTPFVRPGDDQDPRDENGKSIYDDGVTLPETWGAMERLVDEGKCHAIGLSDVGLEQLAEINRSARVDADSKQILGATILGTGGGMRRSTACWT